MVMELVEGGTLVGWLDAYGRMPASLACDVLEQVASGLMVAHRRGVVHRDVKPHNVLITLDGQCKLTDFGIAQVRIDDQSREMTRTGSTMGTVGYMAPEQRSDAKTVDHRADIYSLGALLYKLVTGTILPDLFLVEHEPVLLDDVPDVLHEVIVKACYHDRERRFRNAESFIDTLRQVQTLLPTDPRDTPPLVIPVVDNPTEPGERPFPEIAVLLDAQTPLSADSLAPTRPPLEARQKASDAPTQPDTPPRGAAYSVPVRHPAADAPLYASFPPDVAGPHSVTDSGVRNGIGSLPPSPSQSGGAPMVLTGPSVSLDDDAEWEAAQAAARRWAILMGGVMLAIALMVLASTALVHHEVQNAAVARAGLYETLVEEQGILAELDRAGLAPADVDVLHRHFVAFTQSDREPERLMKAAAYVQALKAMGRPVWAEQGPTGLVRARANAIESAYVEAARAHSDAVQATRSPPGRIAVGLGLVSRP